jgi:hypothetical protein
MQSLGFRSVYSVIFSISSPHISCVSSNLLKILRLEDRYNCSPFKSFFETSFSLTTPYDLEFKLYELDVIFNSLLTFFNINFNIFRCQQCFFILFICMFLELASGRGVQNRIYGI